MLYVSSTVNNSVDKLFGLLTLFKSAKSSQNVELEYLGLLLNAFLDALDLETVQILNCPKAPYSTKKNPNPPKHPKRDKPSRKR